MSTERTAGEAAGARPPDAESGGREWGPVPRRPAGLAARVRAAVTAPGSPWPWIAVAALAIVPHLGVLRNPFVFDDWDIIVTNPYMVHPQAIRRMFSGNVASFLGSFGVSNYYRPLMHLFHYAIYQGFGPRAAWFHAFCLLLHTGVSLLVVAAVRQMSGRREVAALAGLLFAVHPANTEVVSWIASSPDLLCALFSLLSLVLYFRAAEAGRAARALRGGLIFALGASLFLAHLSKEMGVFFPVIIAAWELGVHRRSPSEVLRSRWPELTAMFGVTLLYFALRAYIIGGFLPVQRRVPLPWLEHGWTALAVWYRYAVLMLWPVELNCLHYYLPNRSALDPPVVAGAACLAGFLLLGVWLYRQRRPETAGLLLYALPLLPMFLLPYLSNVLLVFERAAYVPLVGFCWLAAAGLVKLTERWGTRTVTALVVVLLAGYTARSVARVNDWGDEIGLFQEGLAHAPDPFHPLFYQGQAYRRHHRPVEAVAALSEALRLRPGFAEGHNELGRAYFALGRSAEALRHYQAAAALWTREGRQDFAARAWTNSGVVYRALGRNQEAVEAYRTALNLDPKFPAARNNLGFALLLAGRVPEAISELRLALAGDPTLAQAHENLGLAYLMSGRLDEAIAALQQAERISPASAEVQARIGEVLLKRGDAEGARQRFERALQLQPDNPRALAGLAALRPSR